VRYFFEVLETSDRPTDEQVPTVVEIVNAEESSQEAHRDGAVTKDGGSLP